MPLSAPRGSAEQAGLVGGQLVTAPDARRPHGGAAAGLVRAAAGAAGGGDPARGGGAAGGAGGHGGRGGAGCQGDGAQRRGKFGPSRSATAACCQVALMCKACVGCSSPVEHVLPVSRKPEVQAGDHVECTGPWCLGAF